MTPMIVEHPLLQHKISLLRNKQTGTKEFRDLVGEIATLLCYEATRDLPLEEVEIETPITMAKTKVLAGRKLALVPILRAGMGMLDGMLTLLPAAKVGFIGLYRDEKTLQPVEYFCKLPQDIAERDVLVLDPMLATGGSASAAITLLKDKGIKNIKLMCLVAAPQGVQKVNADHPDVRIYVAALDDTLNDQGYIVPGLGDAGDRIGIDHPHVGRADRAPLQSRGVGTPRIILGTGFRRDAQGAQEQYGIQQPAHLRSRLFYSGSRPWRGSPQRGRGGRPG